MRLEDKYRSMTEEEREEERRKLEAYEEREERRAGQYGGGMWDECAEPARRRWRSAGKGFAL